MANFFSRILGDSKLKSLEDRIENSIRISPPPISPPNEVTSEVIPSEIINAFVTHDDPSSEAGKKILSKISGDDNEITSLLDKIVVPGDRLNRYDVYSEIYASVPIIKRMFKVYISNILNKNPVTGRSIFIKDSTNPKFKHLKADQEYEQKKESAKTFIDSIIEHFDIIKKLKFYIVPNMLKYGDAFVEVFTIDEWNTDKKSNSKEETGGNQILTESKEDVDSTEYQKKLGFSEEYIIKRKIKDLNEQVKRLTYKSIDDDDYLFNSMIDNIAECLVSPITSDNFLYEKDLQENSFIDPFLAEKISFDNIIFLMHEPKNIIVLETEYGTRVGYIEVRQSQEKQYNNVNQQLSAIIGKMTSIGNKVELTQDVIINKIVKIIIKRIVSETAKTEKINGVNSDKILQALSPELYNYIKRLLIETNKSDPAAFSKIKSRFIPIKRMFQFTMPSSEYTPYGASIIDPLILQSKLYIISQLANIITKLSRAALIRKWIIDVGPGQMHSGMIQKIKRELYNTRVTLDDLGSFKNIPKILSDFKDMFVLSRGGQRTIDLEVEAGSDPSIKIADLEDARREMIALSGIPAPYLGYNEVVELREQLIHSNLTFSTEVADIQEGIVKNMNGIIDRIAELVGFELVPSQYLEASLIPPVVLMLQLIEMTSNSAANITSYFQNLQIPFNQYYFLEKYIPYIDWDDFKAESLKAEAEKKTGTELEQNAAMAMGGGMPPQ